MPILVNLITVLYQIQSVCQVSRPTFYPQVQHWDEKETAIGIMDNTLILPLTDKEDRKSVV